MQYNSASKIAPYHVATTTMLDSWYSVFRIENLTFTSPPILEQGLDS